MGLDRDGMGSDRNAVKLERTKLISDGLGSDRELSVRVAGRRLGG